MIDPFHTHGDTLLGFLVGVVGEAVARINWKVIIPIFVGIMTLAGSAVGVAFTAASFVGDHKVFAADLQKLRGDIVRNEVRIEKNAEAVRTIKEAVVRIDAILPHMNDTLASIERKLDTHSESARKRK